MRWRRADPRFALAFALLVAAPARAQSPTPNASDSPCSSCQGPLRTWGTGEEAEVSPLEPAPPSEPEVPAPRAEPARDPSTPIRYVLDAIQVSGNVRTQRRVILALLPFRPGDRLDVQDTRLRNARFRLLGTGFFHDVSLSLRRGRARGRAVLVVTVRERSTVRVNDVWLGVSADAEVDGRARPLTAYGGLDVAETNLLGTGISLGGAAAVADRQLALRTRVLDPALLGSSFAVYGELLYAAARDFFGQRDVQLAAPSGSIPVDYAVVSYKRFGGVLGAGHELGSPRSRLFAELHLESLAADLPRGATHVRGGQVVPLSYGLEPGASVYSSLRASYVYDARDRPMLATRGARIGVSAEGSPKLISDYAFAKLQARAEYNFPVWGEHVLRLEAFAGAIVGDAPLFLRYYIGDFSDLLPDRVLELNVDRRPAPNVFGTAIREVRYGVYAGRVQAEYRVPLFRGRRSVYGVDAFASLGLYAVADRQDVTRPAAGYRGLAKVPADMTFNLGMRADTALGAMTLGISTLIGFLPLRRGEP